MDNTAIRERLKSYFETGDKPTQAQFAEFIDSSLYIVEKVLYEDLVSLRDYGKLIPGQFYRITDYITTTTQVNTQSTGNPFDIIVLALSESVLSDQAWAIQSARDTDGYFANSKLSSWQIWYSLDNDTTRFAWADTTNGKGVIYRMIDEVNNDCPYDFKNIQFRHPNTTTDSNYYYTFSVVLSGVVGDHSLNGGYCYENKIGVRINSGKQQLNNIVFINTSKTSSCYSNSFGASCHSISFGNSCQNNNFGNYCYKNSFGNDCYFNNFGNSCFGNSFGNSCFGNSFGNGCYFNNFGYSCYQNSFGAFCDNNSFGNSCQNNNFGNYCYKNSFGNSCQNNHFGNSCQNNHFGNSCFGNSFGNYCRFNNFGNYCIYNRAEDGVEFVELYNIQTASSNQQVQNYHLTRGLNSKTIEVERNRAYETIVAVDSSGNVKQFCVADIIQ